MTHALARQNDFFTSHDAAAAELRSPTRRTRKAALLGLLERYPGRTYQELFQYHEVECKRRGGELMFRDAPSLMRRLNDWAMSTGKHRQCRVTGKQAKTWELRK